MYAVYTNRNVQVSPHVVEGNFKMKLWRSEFRNATYDQVRPIIGEIQYLQFAQTTKLMLVSRVKMSSVVV